MINIARLLLKHHALNGYEVPCSEFMSLFNHNGKTSVIFEGRPWAYDAIAAEYYLFTIGVRIYITVNGHPRQGTMLVQYVKYDAHNIGLYMVEQLFTRQEPRRPMSLPNSFIWCEKGSANSSADTNTLMEMIRADICSIMTVQE